jgi:hypothetical protein
MPDPNDHDLLITLHEKVSNLISQVSRLTDDHESRIRALEKFRWIIVGALIAVQAISDVIIYYLHSR